jgi:hypothetical protein
MRESFELLSEYAPMLLEVMARGFLVFITSLGLVYILGRMLGILKTNTTKNVIALIAMTGLSYWSILIYDEGLAGKPIELGWRIALYLGVSSVFYVLIGFELYDRFNGWVDSKFGKPDHKKPIHKKGAK